LVPVIVPREKVSVDPASVPSLVTILKQHVPGKMNEDGNPP
jgi:hypothetical protein